MVRRRSAKPYILVQIQVLPYNIGEEFNNEKYEKARWRFISIWLFVLLVIEPLIVL